MKEIKVRKFRDENDDYVELYKVIDRQENTPEYFGRYTYADQGEWYYISDPLGYCEMESAVPDDVMFIICDESGNECCRYSNADENPLPKFDTVIDQEWAKIGKKLNHPAEDWKMDMWAETQSRPLLPTRRWLLTFKDPEKYGKEIASMNGYDENWAFGLHSSEVKYVPVPDTEFEYLGKKYQFVKVTCRHDICGATWDEYVCTDAPYVLRESYAEKGKQFICGYKCMLSRHEEEEGPMYDRLTAKQNVQDSLLNTMEENGYTGRRLLHVEGNYCYERSYDYVVDELIRRDLRKSTIEEMCSRMKEIYGTVLFPCNNEGKGKIKQMYPGIYGYDWCLI